VTEQNAIGAPVGQAALTTTKAEENRKTSLTTRVMPALVARISSQKDQREAEGLVAASEIAIESVNAELARLDAKQKTLQAQIRKHRLVAMGLKAVTLLGGLSIVTEAFSGAEQIVGVAIFLAGLADTFAGNFSRFRNKIVEAGVIEEIFAAVSAADKVAADVMRRAPKHPIVALRMYADFWQHLQSMILEKNDGIRQAANKLEREIADQLKLESKGDA
jgi:hypothetical protein